MKKKSNFNTKNVSSPLKMTHKKNITLTGAFRKDVTESGIFLFLKLCTSDVMQVLHLKTQIALLYQQCAVGVCHFK
jgi:hypothetical protein